VRIPFPFAWYLPNGTKKASTDELERASSSCECAGVWCGVLVVVCVVAELIIAWYDPGYETFLKLSLVPDAGIGLGIIGEVLFGMRNSRIQTELRERSNRALAAAVKDAADARKETEFLRERLAWRTISWEQEESLKYALSDLKGSAVAVWFVMNDP
jgi:hypothetical protein